MSAMALAETNRVVLHGRLKDLFGGPFDLGVNSPLEAVRALCLMMKGFRDALSIGHYRVVYGPRDTGMELSLDQTALRLGRGNQVHIIPEAVGAGGRGMGVGKIILGIALIALAIFVPFTIPLVGAIALSSTSVAMFGFSMLLSGIATLFAPNPSNGTGQKKHESFLISGSVNSVGQGEPVPLCYGGPIRAGSTVISLTYTVADIPVNFKSGTDSAADAPAHSTDRAATITSGSTSTGSTQSVFGPDVGGGEFSGDISASDSDP